MSESTDPLRQFQLLYAAAKERESFDASRAALATVGPEGLPSVRYVLAKNLERGVFDVFTNLESVKARDLRHTPHAALAFHWSSTGVQVRVSGPVSEVPSDEADAYFDSRPRGSQLGAWASAQSRPLDDPEALREAVNAQAVRFEGKPVTRPPYWGGFRIAPLRVELWHNRDDRLHERYSYERDGDGYRCARLFP